MSKKVKGDPTGEPINTQPSLGWQPLLTRINVHGPVLYDSTQIEPDWFRKDPWQDGWKTRVLPTLCLWAGAQSNVWSTPKDRIVRILTLVIPVVFPALDLFSCGLMATHKCVGAVCALFTLVSRLILFDRLTSTCVTGDTV